MAQHPKRWNDAEVRARQAKALAFKLGGMTLQQIVEADIGYTSTAGVGHAIKRALDEEVSTNAQEVIKEEIGRLDSLLRTWWPRAKGGNIDGKKVEPDPKAALMVVKLMDRRSRYLGLDFMDGVMERHVAVQEQQVKLAAEVVRRVLGDPELALTEEQRQKVPAVANRHLNAVAA